MSEKTNRAAFVPRSPWLDGLPRNKRLWGCLLRPPKMNSQVGQRGLLLDDPSPAPLESCFSSTRHLQGQATDINDLTPKIAMIVIYC
ncbi:hypothetical protein NL676_022497 [Syzygium grande]|nr:hypothetical protein NL676_022497 [Syzygium grande]